MKHSLGVLAFLGLAALAPAQSRSTDLEIARERLLSAFGNLAMLDQFNLRIAGEEEVRNRIVPFETNLAVARGGTPEEPTVFLEMISRRDGKLVERVVADGSQLWIYDYVANTYGSMTYRRSAAGVRTMIDALRRRQVGANLAGMTLVSQIQRARLEGAGVVASTWAPMSSMAQVTLNDTEIVATAGRPFWNRTVHELVKRDSVNFDLRALRYESVLRLGGKDVSAVWRIDIDTALPTWVSFRFNPGNAKPISMGLSQRG